MATAKSRMKRSLIWNCQSLIQFRYDNCNSEFIKKLTVINFRFECTQIKVTRNTTAWSSFVPFSRKNFRCFCSNQTSYTDGDIYGSVSKQYNILVEQNTIREDKSQRHAVRLLDKLLKDIALFETEKLNARNQKILGKNSFASWIFSSIAATGYRNEKSLDLRAPSGIYLHGGPGSGKTFTMELFYKLLHISEKQRVHFNEFMLKIHRMLFSLRKGGVRSDQLMKECVDALCKECSVLCFDEFQVTDIADAMILRTLFKELLGRGMVVVMTSNRAPDELYKNGIQRELFIPFIEDVKRRFTVINMESEIDYRLLSVEQMNLDFSVDSANAPRTSLQPMQHHGAYFIRGSTGLIQTAAFERLFETLTDGSVVDDCFLRVQGRTFDVPQAARNDDVARFSFDSLCGQPRGAADYYAIASSFHTVFVDDVPRLKLSMINTLRRFITMVDIFYDERVMLVICCEVGIQNLFDAEGVNSEDDIESLKALGMSNTDVIGDPKFAQPSSNLDEVFAFSRTKSRLYEMNRADYLLHHRRRVESADPSAVRFFSRLGSVCEYKGMKRIDIKHIWNKYDRDKNGKIDQKELEQLLEDITLFNSGHRHVPKEVFDATMAALSPNGEQDISWERFESYFLKYGLTVRG